MKIIKDGGHRLFENDPETAKLVSEMLLDLEKHGFDAVRRYSEKFDDWKPKSFELTPQEIKAAIAELPKEVIDDTDFLPGERPLLRTGAEGNAGPARDGTAARRDPRPQAHPGEPRGQLHPRRPLSDVRFGADEHHPGESRGREKRDRLHAAGEGRRLFPGNDQRDPQGGARTGSSSLAAFRLWR